MCLKEEIVKGNHYQRARALLKLAFIYSDKSDGNTAYSSDNALELYNELLSEKELLPLLGGADAVRAHMQRSLCRSMNGQSTETADVQIYEETLRHKDKTVPWAYHLALEELIVHLSGTDRSLEDQIRALQLVEIARKDAYFPLSARCTVLSALINLYKNGHPEIVNPGKAGEALLKLSRLHQMHLFGLATVEEALSVFQETIKLHPSSLDPANFDDYIRDIRNAYDDIIAIRQGLMPPEDSEEYTAFDSELDNVVREYIYFLGNPLHAVVENPSRIRELKQMLGWSQDD